MNPGKFLKRDNTRYGRRHTPGEMNRTESKYAQLLEVDRLAGQVIRWEFEAITFKLAADCRYTPDFAVWLANGEMEFIDVKGGGPMDDKSRVKVRVAAERFPQFTFAIVQLRSAKQGGGWHRQQF